MNSINGNEIEDKLIGNKNIDSLPHGPQPWRVHIR